MTALALVIRGFLGLVLFGTALGKALDVPGFVGVVLTYDVFRPVLAWPSAVAMVLTEFGLSFWLLSGRRLKQAALVCAALHMVFIAWASLALLRGLELDNCGCFGVFFQRPLTGWTLVEDAVLVGLSLVLAALAMKGPGHR